MVHVCIHALPLHFLLTIPKEYGSNRNNIIIVFFLFSLHRLRLTAVLRRHPPRQEKFEQLVKELPMISGMGCEIRVKNLGYSVQRAKGTADEPTVGDNFLALCQCMMCIPLLTRLAKGQEMERKTILKGVNAIFKPGTTTLILGAPGCGKVSRAGRAGRGVHMILHIVVTSLSSSHPCKAE